MQEIVTMEREDDWFVIRHHEAGLVTQGRSRVHALMMLADLMALDEGTSLGEVQDTAKEVFWHSDEQTEKLDELIPDEEHTEWQESGEDT